MLKRKIALIVALIISSQASGFGLNVKHAVPTWGNNLVFSEEFAGVLSTDRSSLGISASIEPGIKGVRGGTGLSWDIGRYAPGYDELTTYLFTRLSATYYYTDYEERKGHGYFGPEVGVQFGLAGNVRCGWNRGYTNEEDSYFHFSIGFSTLGLLSMIGAL